MTFFSVTIARMRSSRVKNMDVIIVNTYVCFIFFASRERLLEDEFMGFAAEPLKDPITKKLDMFRWRAKVT